MKSKQAYVPHHDGCRGLGDHCPCATQRIPTAKNAALGEGSVGQGKQASPWARSESIGFFTNT